MESQEGVTNASGLNESKEVLRDLRSYKETRKDLDLLIKNENPAEEVKLKMEQKKLVDAAKKAGLFTSLKGTIKDLQDNYGGTDFESVILELEDCDVNQFELEARGTGNWDDRFEGLLQAYKDGAVRAMYLAKLKAAGQENTINYKERKREVDLLNWGTPVLGLGILAKRSNEGKKETGYKGLEQLMGKQPLPTHVRAVFKEGRNSANYIRREDDPHLITLDITNKDNHWKYILRNLEAFNNVFDDQKSWIAVLFNWRGDAQDAARAFHYEQSPDYQDFEKNLYASMAITSSARLLEECNANLGDYLLWITGEAQEVDNAKQVQWKPYLLHGDDSKVETVLKNDAVRGYFYKLLTDAGIKGKPTNYDQIVEAVVRASADKVRGSDLVKDFLRSKSEGGGDYEWGGGFDGYVKYLMNQEGVNNEDPNRFEEWQAAKLACDLFFTIAYTRYDDIVTERGKKYDDFKLKPCINWAGDSLVEIINPPNLPKNVKKVYSQDTEIWDYFSAAFRPRDNFLINNSEDYVKKLLRPDATVSIQNANRYHQALSAVIGDPLASSLPDISGKGIEGLIKSISLMFQVYPQLGLNNIEGSDRSIDKQILAAMLSRLVLTKVLAFKEEFSMGKLRSLKNIISPDEKSAPVKALAEFGVAIWGPTEAIRKEGVIRMLETRYNLDFGGNLEAENDLALARREMLALGANPSLVTPAIVGRILYQTSKMFLENTAVK